MNVLSHKPVGQNVPLLMMELEKLRGHKATVIQTLETQVIETVDCL